MIKQTTIINTDDMNQYLYIEFTDGTFASLSEKELKNAAILAEKGCLDA